MIPVISVSVTFGPDNTCVFESIEAADNAVRAAQASSASTRYEYVITWADGTRHLSRSREASVTDALSGWIKHFSNPPVGTPADILSHRDRLGKSLLIK